MDDLWHELDVALTLKRTREATLGRLNQLVQKRFPHLPKAQLTQQNCELWRESLTATQLQQCNAKHDRAKPCQMTGPIVVFESGGQRYMLDGTNRLNVWLSTGDNSRHDVILVKRRDSENDR